jgi:hypothetical protein
VLRGLGCDQLVEIWIDEWSATMALVHIICSLPSVGLGRKAAGYWWAIAVIVGRSHPVSDATGQSAQLSESPLREVAAPDGKAATEPVT